MLAVEGFQRNFERKGLLSSQKPGIRERAIKGGHNYLEVVETFGTAEKQSSKFAASDGITRE